MTGVRLDGRSVLSAVRAFYLDIAERADDDPASRGRHAALAHYDQAAEAAGETGDANMITSVWTLKSHLAWSQGDAARAVGLAQAGQRDPDR